MAMPKRFKVPHDRKVGSVFVGIRNRCVIFDESLEDCRLAIVRFADYRKARHTVLLWSRQQFFEPRPHLEGACIADPERLPKSLDSLGFRESVIGVRTDEVGTHELPKRMTSA